MAEVPGRRSQEVRDDNDALWLREKIGGDLVGADGRMRWSRGWRVGIKRWRNVRRWSDDG